ncbi:CASP-like protein 2C1 [Euphorbia peplus]|nr:CASP-like protein 2C1 [Euphorbia peplus]
MEVGIHKIEAILRILSILLWVTSACILGLDSQTASLVYIEKTVTYKYLKSLLVLLNINCAAAAYNMLQLCKYYILVRLNKGKFKGSNTYLAWASFFLDQVAAYITYAATLSAVGESMFVVTGMEMFQWMKWCNRFTKFCFQMGTAVAFSFIASLLMGLVSVISAFNVFRLYRSLKHFLHLKPCLINYNLSFSP